MEVKKTNKKKSKEKKVKPKRTTVKCELKQIGMIFEQNKGLDKDKDKGEFRNKNKGQQ